MSPYACTDDELALAESIRERAWQLRQRFQFPGEQRSLDMAMAEAERGRWISAWASV